MIAKFHKLSSLEKIQYLQKNIIPEDLIFWLLIMGKKDVKVRQIMARNAYPESQYLKHLAKDENPSVRREVAKIPRLPLSIVEILIKDDDIEVKINLVYSQEYLCRDHLDLLSRDKSKIVRKKARN